MIAERYITEWSERFTWTKNSFVEQDMVICRALVDIFSDPYLSNALAFRGGTAIHKLHFSPQVRYSEDIDLVQVEPGPVKPITERLGLYSLTQGRDRGKDDAARYLRSCPFLTVRQDRRTRRRGDQGWQGNGHRGSCRDEDQRNPRKEALREEQGPARHVR